jgi:phosphatidylinositol alpha-1,6-mannosyltransferase
MISKPITPPWNDSSKNLVKDLALSGSRFSYRVLTPQSYRLDGQAVINEPIYRARGSYTPPLEQNLRVFWRLFAADDAVLTHFFFAPNRKTTLAARLALRFRRRKTIQTVCSTPSSFQQASQLLFADRVIVLSEHTYRQFIEAGIPAQRLALIPPGIQIPSLPRAEDRTKVRQRYGIALDRPAVIYPGDYQFSQAAETLARAIITLGTNKLTFVFACRIKQPASLEVEGRIRRMLSEAGVSDGVKMVNEVEDMLGLLGACDLCLLPAESLYAKMDLPLVLLEAMALGLPILVANRPPLSELVHPGVGEAIPAQDPQALVAAIDRLVENRERLKAMGETARRVASERYDIAQVAKQYEDLYEQLLQE